MAELTQKMVDDVGRALIERGKIIAAGFEGYKLMFRVRPVQGAKEEELERRAFFAGAHHLFALIMDYALSAGAEPTDADMKRMDNIANELKEFEKVLELMMH